MIKSTINSTLGLATGFLLTIILHELAHYIMSVILGYEATLYHNSGNTGDVDPSNGDIDPPWILVTKKG
ncbi:hypothetical protein GCM10027284_38140 [Cyclobacterium sediminis]